MNDSVIVKLDAARLALSECKTVMEAKQVADVAEAARVYLERTNASAETVNRATEIRILAERQMGAFLKTMPRVRGASKLFAGRDSSGSRIVVAPENPVPTIAQMGISSRKSEDAQKLADIPEPEFQERVAVAKASGGKLTTSAILNKSRRRAEGFNFGAWKKQSRSVMISWLQSVPDEQRPDAAKYLSELPETIVQQLQ